MIGSCAISAVGEQWLDALDSDEDVVAINLDGILGKTAPAGIEALARVGIEDPLWARSPEEPFGRPVRGMVVDERSNG
ncbi:hypothetical protein KAF44_26865 (plasmid) [Cupriavidus necator]|nr:hypothetical protein KAF44_26865 [Cupriavidus necator]